MSVTLVCIAIPCIIPLYLRVRKRISSNGSYFLGRYKKQSRATEDHSHELWRPKAPAGVAHYLEVDERRAGINGPFNEVSIMYTNNENESDEAILTKNSSRDKQSNGITVTEEVTVSTTTRTT